MLLLYMLTLKCVQFKIIFMHQFGGSEWPLPSSLPEISLEVSIKVG